MNIHGNLALNGSDQFLRVLIAILRIGTRLEIIRDLLPAG